jgi:hypothetical protein
VHTSSAGRRWQRPVEEDRLEAVLGVSVEEPRDLPRGPAETSEAADLAAEELVGDNPYFDSLDVGFGNRHGL